MGLFHESVTSEQWNCFDVLRLLELSNQAVISACISRTMRLQLILLLGLVVISATADERIKRPTHRRPTHRLTQVRRRPPPPAAAPNPWPLERHPRLPFRPPRNQQQVPSVRHLLRWPKRRLAKPYSGSLFSRSNRILPLIAPGPKVHP